jgi:hypothetical protein
MMGHLQFLLVLASAVIMRPESRVTHDHILLSQVWDFPNLESQVPVFMCPRNRVARLCPQALGSFCVIFHDSQGYGGGIRPHFYTGVYWLWTILAPVFLLITFCTDRVENTVSYSSSIVTCISVAARTCLPSRWLETTLVCLLISRSLHSNGSTRYSM